MGQEHDWKAILTGAVPASSIVAYVFYANSSFKWYFLLIGIAVSLGVSYYMDRKKQTIFTSAFIVLIVALVVHVLRNSGIL
jgi:hypothetical protein